MSEQTTRVIAFFDASIAKALLFGVSVLFLLWFTNVPIYVNLFYLPWLTPSLWVMVTLAGISLVSLAYDSWTAPLNSTLVVWWIMLVSINVAWYAGFGGGDPVVLDSRVASLMFLAVSYFAFATSPALVEVLRVWLIPAVCLAAALNFYNVLHPFAFVPPSSDYEIFARAAGLYLNPNTAGSAIVLGMILCIEKVPIRWRSLFLAICAAAILVTLSRAAILGFCLAIVAFASVGILPRRVLWEMFGMFALVVVGLAIFLWPLISDALSSDALDRLLWFTNLGQGGDFSQDERLYLAAHGWEQFTNQPLLGNGVGSTEFWVHRSSTHNQYLQFLSDFGILGGFIIPVLAIAVCVRRRRADWTPLFVAGFLLFWSLFSHSIFTEPTWLMALAMAAALNRSDESATSSGERLALTDHQ